MAVFIAGQPLLELTFPSAASLFAGSKVFPTQSFSFEAWLFSIDRSERLELALFLETCSNFGSC